MAQCLPSECVALGSIRTTAKQILNHGIYMVLSEKQDCEWRTGEDTVEKGRKRKLYKGM